MPEQVLSFQPFNHPRRTLDPLRILMAAPGDTVPGGRVRCSRQFLPSRIFETETRTGRSLPPLEFWFLCTLWGLTLSEGSRGVW
ncbi:MAG: hypothetical protein JWM10_3192 [Myxococcaceae bacterium]|nr:hypothetical protein [Myxococcaceae bacterium]